jgi:hypothetical protein
MGEHLKKFKIVVCNKCGQEYNDDAWFFCPYCAKPDMSKIKRHRGDEEYGETV